MSEATDKAVTVLTGLIEKAAGGLDSAVEFSQAQIPDVVNQLLIWNFSRSLILSVLFIASLPFVFKFMKKQATKCGKWTLFYDDSDDIHPGSILAVVIFLIYIVIVFVQVSNLTWLKIWLAPKLYLLEYAASLVK